MEQQKKAASEYVRSTFNRTPISFDELLKEVNDAGFPADVSVHPLDFFFLIGMGGQVHKDNTGPYFYLSSSRVRPTVPPKGSTLDLAAWEPPRISTSIFLKGQ